MKDLINKFIGMNTETRRRTITAVVIAIINFLTVFGIIQFDSSQVDAIVELIVVIATGIVWAYCSHYKNNDYSEAASLGTGISRQIKQEQKVDYVGERFYTNDDGDLLNGENDDDITEEVDGDVMAVEEMQAEADADGEEFITRKC